MTPREPLDSIIDNAAAQLTHAQPSDALRANVMARVSVERPSRFVWRYVFAGGALASIALVAFASWPANRAIPNPTISNPAISNPTLINPTILNSPANPTAAVTAASVPSSVKAARRERVANYAMSTSELEWRARATPALDHPDSLSLKSLELKSIDITPLGVAPLTVPAVGDGQNR